jgi:hypothetical protein
MRTAIALLLIIAGTGLAAAQQQKPASNSDEILRQRLLIQERFNKGYDVQLENANDRIQGRCKGEARRRFSAFHPLKRRRFIAECIARAKR